MTTTTHRNCNTTDLFTYYNTVYIQVQSTTIQYVQVSIFLLLEPHWLNPKYCTCSPPMKSPITVKCLIGLDRQVKLRNVISHAS